MASGHPQPQLPYQLGHLVRELPEIKLNIKYQSSSFEDTDRDVVGLSIWGFKDDEPKYIHCYCQLRNAERTFRLDKISEVCELESGIVYENIEHFLWAGCYNRSWPIGYIEKLPQFLFQVNRLPAIVNANVIATIVHERLSLDERALQESGIIPSGSLNSELRTYKTSNLSAFYYGRDFMLETQSELLGAKRAWRGTKRFYDFITAELDGISFSTMTSFVKYVCEKHI